MTKYRAFFDGVASGNPGPAGIGYVVYNSEGKITAEHSEKIGIATNNEAEYRALISLAGRLVEENIQTVVISGDSQLVINQVNGNWQVKQTHLYELYKNAVKLLSCLQKWELNWVPRKKNSKADELSKKAIDGTNTHLPKKFDGQIEKITDSIYLAYGTKVYAVDLENNACTCPAFVNKKTRPCKHLLAVENRISGR
jgi:ribonuclease HI